MEALTALVNKLPSEFLMIIIVLALIVVVIYIPRLRHKKTWPYFYIFSAGFEHNKQYQKKILTGQEEIKAKQTEIAKRVENISADGYINQALIQRTILFDESSPLGERLAAGSVLEQLSNGWTSKEHHLNGEARGEYEFLCALERSGKVHRNECVESMNRPVVRIGRDGSIVTHHSQLV